MAHGGHDVLRGGKVQYREQAADHDEHERDDAHDEPGALRAADELRSACERERAAAGAGEQGEQDQRPLDDLFHYRFSFQEAYFGERI